MTKQFNPTEVPINYTLNIGQVNLILEGLAELPRKRTEGFFDQLKAVAVQTVEAAAKAHSDAIEKEEAAEAARKAPPEPAGEAA